MWIYPACAYGEFLQNLIDNNYKIDFENLKAIIKI